jgi:hypothetical protein
MRKPGWYIVTTDPGGTHEQDAFRCGHCQHIVKVKPFADPASMGGRCTCCNALLCPTCVGQGCNPLEKQIERREARDRMAREW